VDNKNTRENRNQLRSQERANQITSGHYFFLVDMERANQITRGHYTYPKKKQLVDITLHGASCLKTMEDIETLF